MTDFDDADFNDAMQGLRNGDFTRLAPLFAVHTAGVPSTIAQWLRDGRLAIEGRAVAEAFSCACFNGFVDMAKELLDAGVDPLAGNGTGLDGFHWAVNRGQLAVVELLISRGVSTETINAHGTTLLGTALWSAANEPSPDHAQIITLLRAAGAT